MLQETRNHNFCKPSNAMKYLTNYSLENYKNVTSTPQEIKTVLNTVFAKQNKQIQNIIGTVKLCSTVPATNTKYQSVQERGLFMASASRLICSVYLSTDGVSTFLFWVNVVEVKIIRSKPNWYVGGTHVLFSFKIVFAFCCLCLCVVCRVCFVFCLLGGGWSFGRCFF